MPIDLLPSLKNHPFAVDAFFEKSIVLTFCVPKAELAPLIPDCLELDTWNDTWGFVAMAMVQTKHLRPSGFPTWMGNDFFLVGYRIFVKYHTQAGKRLRGLYIIKSETDKRKMTFFGNLFTHYHYGTTDISCLKIANEIRIGSRRSQFDVRIEHPGYEVTLPKHSPFASWKEARRFAGPLPFTFTYNAQTKEVLIIEGRRESWTPMPVNILSHDISFLKTFRFSRIEPANAFIVENVPYHWRKGRMEIWKP